jgi:hypothetical protein
LPMINASRTSAISKFHSDYRAIASRAGGRGKLEPP